MLLRSLMVGLLPLLVVACNSDQPVGLDGFDTSAVAIDGREFVVAVAETPNERSRGLMGVTDLAGLDGMLFVFPSDTDGGFWMKDTLIPLDIAFFAADGVLVDVLTMEPCTADPCPTYRPGGAYRYAVEAPQGDLEFVAPGARLVIIG